MVDKETKASYIKLIKKAYVQNTYAKEICDFIDTYDGTNEDEFRMLVFTLVLIFIEREKAALNAQTLFEMEAVQKRLTNDTEALRFRYETTQNGLTPNSVISPTIINSNS